MELKAVLQSREDLDELDETARGYYSEAADGKYQLRIGGIDDHPAVAGLRRTLKKFRDVEPNADRLRARLEAADRLQEALGGLDADEIQAKLSRIEELENEGGNASELQAKFDAQLEAREKRYARDLANRDEEIATLRAGRQKDITDRALDEGLDKIKAPPHYRKAIKLLMKERGIEVVEEDGGLQAVMELDGQHVPAPVYLERWAREDPEAGHYLDPSGNSGTGSQGEGSTRRNGRVNPYKKGETFNMTEQARMERDNPVLARQLAADAGVKLQTA